MYKFLFIFHLLLGWNMERVFWLLLFLSTCLFSYSAIHRIWLKYSLLNASRAGYNILLVDLSQFDISIFLKTENFLDTEIITRLWVSCLVKVKDQHINILKGINVGVALEAVLHACPSYWVYCIGNAWNYHGGSKS
jgi:hypothetical protein